MGRSVGQSLSQPVRPSVSQTLVDFSTLAAPPTTCAHAPSAQSNAFLGVWPVLSPPPCRARLTSAHGTRQDRRSPPNRHKVRDREGALPADGFSKEEIRQGAIECDRSSVRVDGVVYQVRQIVEGSVLCSVGEYDAAADWVELTAEDARVARAAAALVAGVQEAATARCCHSPQGCTRLQDVESP